MKRKATLSTNIKWIFYLTMGSLLLSGVAWMVWKAPMLMRIHGAGAILALIMFGWLIPSHIQIGLQKQKRVYTGLILVVVMALFAMSGYGLYYFSNDTLRTVTKYVHNGLGIASPILLIIHLLMPRK